MQKQSKKLLMEEESFRAIRTNLPRQFDPTPYKNMRAHMSWRTEGDAGWRASVASGPSPATTWLSVGRGPCGRSCLQKGHIWPVSRAGFGSSWPLPKKEQELVWANGLHRCYVAPWNSLWLSRVPLCGGWTKTSNRWHFSLGFQASGLQTRESTPPNLFHVRAEFQDPKHFFWEFFHIFLLLKILTFWTDFKLEG